MLMSDEDLQRRPQHPPVIIYTHPPKPIVVEAENFLTLVQRLTGGASKRKRVTFQDLEAVSHESSPSPFKVRTLQEYLDKLEEECPPIQSLNKPFFSTAGLVKGVKSEDGLQIDGPDAPHQSPLSSTDAGATQDESQDDSATIRSFAHLLTPLPSLASSKFLSSDWMEGPGCLSPRSYQVIKHAKRTAACRNLSGSGPWKICPEKMQAEHACSGTDEWDLQVDRLYCTGEVTLVGQV